MAENWGWWTGKGPIHGGYKTRADAVGDAMIRLRMAMPFLDPEKDRARILVGLVENVIPKAEEIVIQPSRALD